MATRIIDSHGERNRWPSRTSWYAAALAAVVIMLAGLWWATSGDFHPFKPMAFGNVYEAQARSLTSGRTDIACGVASGEAFVRDGKCYVYFGPTPAVLRMLPIWLVPGLDGKLSRVMVWLSQLFFLGIIGLILVEAGHPLGSWTSTGYLLLTAFGTTVPYMWGWPTTYVEAIAWAVAFATGSIYCLLKWTNRHGGWWLTCASLLASLAFFSRVSTGAGLMLAVGLAALSVWIGRRPRNQRIDSVLALLLLAVSAGVFVSLNYSRMGTYLDALPVRLHVQYDAERLARIDGTLFHPKKGFEILVEYLFQYPSFRASFPWLDYRNAPFWNLERMDLLDRHVGVVPMMTALAWLAWHGLRSKLDRLKLALLLSPLVSLALVVTVAAINQRYVHEFVLLLAPAGAYGLRTALSSAGRRWVTIFLTGWSVYACWALALVGQRELMPWVDEDARDRHYATVYRIDRWLRGDRVKPVDYDYRDSGSLPPRVAGARIRIIQTDSIYEFDGSRWLLRTGRPLHRFRTRIRFDDLPETPFNLLIAGKLPDADSFFLERGAAPGRFRLVMDHPGTGGIRGPEFELMVKRDYVFEFELDRLNRETFVKLDLATIGQRTTPLVRWLDSEVSAGPLGELLPTR